MQRKIPIIDLFLSIISLWWAFVLFNEDHMFFRVPKTFEVLAVIQEHGWGFVFLAGALMKIIGVLTEKIWLRKIGLIFSMFLYGLISAGYILSDELIHTATGVYFALCVLALWGYREVKGLAN